MTNFEMIKSMTKEELAEFMAERFACHLCPSEDCHGHRRECEEYLTEWLGQEA